MKLQYKGDKISIFEFENSIFNLVLDCNKIVINTLNYDNTVELELNDIDTLINFSKMSDRFNKLNLKDGITVNFYDGYLDINNIIISYQDLYVIEDYLYNDIAEEIMKGLDNNMETQNLQNVENTENVGSTKDVQNVENMEDKEMKKKIEELSKQLDILNESVTLIEIGMSDISKQIKQIPISSNEELDYKIAQVTSRIYNRLTRENE